ncbi:MAG: hypothetical protein LBG84_04815 [Treponema sp.]|jgi:hypothetical protein|nr:hypothetical protein [Treponema sp.]
MRKTLVLAVLWAGVTAAAFSQVEVWTSVGLEFGNSFQKYPGEGWGYLGAPGLNVNFYRFGGGGNGGLFFHFAALFPVIERRGGSNYDYLFQYDWIIGPGFRWAARGGGFHFGAGLHMGWPLYGEYAGEAGDYVSRAVNFGLGLDAGFKYDLSDRWYIDFGLTLAYDFINATAREVSSGGGRVVTRVSNDTFAGDYSMAGVKPYLGMGVTMYGERYKYGKPPRN